MSPASERESMCTSLNVLAHKTGNPKSPMNPQVSDLSDSGLSFLLLSEFWPHFSFSPMQLACLCAEDAGGLWPEAPGFHHPTSAASGVEPLSPIAPGEEEPPAHRAGAWCDCDQACVRPSWRPWVGGIRPVAPPEAQGAGRSLCPWEGE